MNRIIVLIAVMVFLFGTICSADMSKKHTLDVGTEVYMTRLEQGNEAEERGMMYGGVGSYTYRGAIFPAEELNRMMFKAKGQVARGEADYNNTGDIDDVSQWTWAMEFLFGYGVVISESFGITPFLGAGHRYFCDELDGLVSTTNESGYKRESRYYYIPVGLELTTDTERDESFGTSQGWSFGGSVEFDIFVKGRQKNYYTDADPAASDFEVDQEEGYGWGGSIKIQKNGENLDFAIEPFARLWNTNETETEGNINLPNNSIPAHNYEPKTEILEYGARVTLAF
ncbi:MAG: hypothetical protein V2A72_08480 [Candidatus Omnitrophota bacterium]